MTYSALREELNAAPDPEFEMELPPGWARRQPDDETLAGMLGDLKRRLMQAQRPDVYAQLKAALEQSFEEMRRNGVVAFFSAADPDPATLWLPASINASVRRAEPGKSLDDLARGMIREFGATPLLGDPRTLRFERAETRRDGSDTLIVRTLVYLTPIPGSRRRRALQLVAGFASTPETPDDAPELERMRALFDACVSTLRWRPATARTEGAGDA